MALSILQQRAARSIEHLIEVCAERHSVAEGVIAANQFAKPLPRPRLRHPLDTHRGKGFYAPVQRLARFARSENRRLRILGLCGGVLSRDPALILARSGRN